jgi:hypothetical protein
MIRKFPLLGRVGFQLVAFGTSAVMTLAISGAAYAQGHGRQPAARGGGDQSSGSGGGDQGSTGRQPSRAEPASPPPTPRGDQDRSTGGDSGRSGRAVQRGGGNSDNDGSSGGGRPGAAVTRDTSGDSAGSGTNPVPAYRRPRNGRNATGEAVERPPMSTGGGTTVIVRNGGYGGGYYPWGYGGLGFGGYYGSGYYDPFWYDDYGYGSGSGYGYGYGFDGALKVKVKPRDASVYVDGYFAGRVDDFDGIFQRLRIESGPHRVEIRMDGYEPLAFEVRIQPDRTMTYKGELKRVP